MCSMAYGSRFEIYVETVFKLIKKLDNSGFFHSPNESAMKSYVASDALCLRNGSKIRGAA